MVSSNPQSRRVSFHTSIAAEPSASVGSPTAVASNTGYPTPVTTGAGTYSSSGVSGGSSSFRARNSSSNLGGIRLKPLTQLHKSETAPDPPNYDAVIDLDNKCSGAPTKNMYQSEHSRRGSASAESFINSIARQPSGSYGTATSQSSLPNLSLAARIKPTESNDDYQDATSAPHPYDVILPGQETRRVPTKARTMSAVAHTTVGPTQTASLANQGRTLPVGARRFTQTAHTSTTQNPSSASGTINIAAALHARRFSSVAREPSAAAAFSRNYGGVGVSTLDKENTSEAKRISREDTQMLLTSLRALIGKDGGGEAVGKFVSFILQGGLSQVQDELMVLMGQTLSNVPSLHAAYVTVHFHEIVAQLQKLGKLLLAESEVALLIENVLGQFRHFSNRTSTASEGLSISNLFAIFMQTLQSSPVYKSALLKLIETVCKLVTASESFRDRMWNAFSQTLAKSERLTNEVGINNIIKFLYLLFGAVEQLTGGPIKPLIKHFLSWIAVADDLLTKLAVQAQNFLNEPCAISTVLSSDYTMHPLGYVYSPSDSSARLDAIFQMWSDTFAKDPAHCQAFDQFKKTLDNVILGISGNSTFARFSRDLARLWKGLMGDKTANVKGTGLEGALECLKTLAVEFVAFELEDEQIVTSDGCQWALSNIKLELADVLPAELSLSTHSKLFPSSYSFESSTQLEIKNLIFHAKMIQVTCKKNGQASFESIGSFAVELPVDLSTSFLPKNNALLQMLVALPYYGGTQVTVHPTNLKPLGSERILIPDPQEQKIQAQVAAKVKETLARQINAFFKAWLTVAPQLKSVSREPGPLSSQSQRGSTGTKSPPPQLPETFGGAREYFKASIRHLTGLKPGSVLNQLQNPFSGPSSPIASPCPDEDIDTKRKRRQSMADYLTDVSKSDSTLPANIKRPPVADSQKQRSDAHNLPNVFDEDDDELPAAYHTMARSLSFAASKDTTAIDKIIKPVISNNADIISVLSHRGGLPNFPTGEMSYEAYQLAEATMDAHHQPLPLAVGPQDILSMAQSLSELATRDTTTEDAIANPPVLDTLTGDSLTGLQETLTMDKVTRHLSGLHDSHIAENPSQRIVRAGGAHMGEPTSRLIMADMLTDSAMEDNTLPEAQATGHLSGPVSALGVPTRPGIVSLASKERVPMSQSLSKGALVDTTLQENIAAPPGASSVNRAPVANNFTGLKTIRSMSTTLDSTLEQDYTTPESQAEMMKLPKTNNQMVGLSDQELRRRRQSFKLSEQAMQDTTLVETIRNPPVVINSISAINSALSTPTESNLLSRKE